MEDFKEQITSFGHVMENHIINKCDFLFWVMRCEVNG